MGGLTSTSNAIQVTDALGTTRTYTFGVIQGDGKLMSISQPCSGCGGGTTYDVNGNVASRTDLNGTRTNYSYDLARNLEISRTEGLTSTGANTSVTRTITTGWHPTFRLPARITEPGRTTDFSYGASGDLLEKELTAGTKLWTWNYTYNAPRHNPELRRPRALDRPRDRHRDHRV